MDNDRSGSWSGAARVHAAASWAVLLVLATVVLKTLDFLFIPLSIAVLLCYALGIPLDFLRQRQVPAWARILLVVGITMIAVYLFGRLIHANVIDFQQQLPELERKFWQYARQLLALLDISTDEAREMINAFMANIKTADLKPVGSMVQQIGGSFFSFLGNLFWVLLFMIFLLAEKESLSRRLVKGLGEERAEPVLAAFRGINESVQHYLGLKTLISLGTGVLVGLGLWLIDIPFALLWGVLAFLLNFIPNIGSLVASLPPVAITLFYTGSVAWTLAVAVVLTVIQGSVGNFVEPKLMGRGLNLSPLVVLIALIFWGWMWGITGMLIAVPLTAAIKVACEQQASSRLVAVMLSGD